MIDLSCCEVKKALRNLFKDSTKFELVPFIAHSLNDFKFNRNTVYFGAFGGVQDELTVINEIVNKEHYVNETFTMFTRFENEEFTCFQGYKIILDDNYINLPEVNYNEFVFEFYTDDSLTTLLTNEEFTLEDDISGATISSYTTDSNGQIRIEKTIFQQNTDYRFKHSPDLVIFVDNDSTYTNDSEIINFSSPIKIFLANPY